MTNTYLVLWKSVCARLHAQCGGLPHTIEISVLVHATDVVEAYKKAKDGDTIGNEAHKALGLGKILHYGHEGDYQTIIDIKKVE